MRYTQLHMSLFRLVTLAVGVALGIVAASFTSVPPSIPLWLLVLAAVSAFLTHQWATPLGRPYLVWLILLLLGGAVGMVRLEQATANLSAQVPPAPLGADAVLSGTIVREPDYRDQLVQLTVATPSSTILLSTDRYHTFRYGDTIVATGTLARPETFTTDYGRTFNYPGYLAVRDVTHVMRFAEVARVATAEEWSLRGWLLAGKERFATAIKEAIPEPAASLGLGLLLGMQAGLGERLEAAFRETGIIHIVVLSGYNVMLVVAFIHFSLAWVRSVWVRVGVGVGAIVLFALIVGGSATVVRASIMACLVLLAFALGRRYDVLRGLLLAGLLMLLINPHLLLYDIGFQLSFMATLGLILVTPQFESTMVTTPQFIRWREFFLATLVTQLAVFPLLLYHIGEVSLVAVLVNVLVLPAVPAAMLLTFLTGLGAMLPAVFAPLVTLVGYLAWLSLTYIIVVAELFAQLPFATLVAPPLPWVVVPFGYSLLLGAWLLWRWYHRHTSPQPADEQLAAWTIELEAVVARRAADAAASAAHRPDQPSREPIFFRD